VATTTAVVIRRARPGDSAQVRALVRQLGYAPDDKTYDETFAQVVRHPEAAVFVAQIGTRLVGYLAMAHRPQIRLAGRIAAIDELAVDDGERGRGVGTSLLDAAIAHAASLGCARVELTTSRERASYSRGFYAERGLAEVDSAVFRQALAAERGRPR
jgi:N-acetylglutamate synthase-like GNAT family acetyltransferase